jgi:FAD/FMN-containing dehydrogenase
MIDVEAALANRGRAIPAGSCATVGVGGLALGGGVGFASRKFGTTSDNIVSLGIVTADGRYRICNATENPSLYWACRGGGGGNFGIVTHFVFRTHAVAPISYFFADWPWAQAAEVVGAWQAFAPHARDELFSICALETGASEPRVQAFGQFMGPQRKLPALLKPLARVAGFRLTLGSSSYLDAQLRWAGCLGKTLAQCHLIGDTPAGTLRRARFAAKSDYVNAPLSRAAADTIVLRRSDQPRAAGCNRVRPQKCSLLGTVPRVLGPALGCCSRGDVASRLLQRHAAVCLRLRLPELHRS